MPITRGRRRNHTFFCSVISYTLHRSIMGFQSLLCFVTLVTATPFIGHAVVLNECNSLVELENVPAAGNGYLPSHVELSPNQRYSYPFIELATGGWSMKISLPELEDPTNIMQFEYTLSPNMYGGVVWFDISYVNGNPLNGNWSLIGDSSQGRCSPAYRAYRYPTDDEHGMQDCPMDSTLVLQLCSRRR